MTTLNDFDNVPDGAHFFSADLHVHSFGGSVDVKDPSMTAAAIVDEAVRQGIAVLAITDHNSIANTRASIDHALRYSGRLLVLAGVEVGTPHGHLLVYFAPEAFDKLQTFLARLEIVDAGSTESRTTRSMADVIAEASRLGGICVAAHIEQKKGFEGSSPGFPTWKKDISTSEGLCGLEFADSANLSWYSADDVTPEAGERRKLLEHRSRALGRPAPLAHVQNSDAHSLADFATSRARRTLTRIKMDALSFDGFKLAFADCEARVRATASLPPAVPQLLAMQVTGGFLRDEKYRFSANLNCFIGGRGTGKSTALRCVAYALGHENALADYDNCPDSVVVYARDASGVLYRYERMRGSAPQVKAKDDHAITDVPADAFPIEYYGQGELADVARDPLAKAKLFQEFLDRNTRLADLFARERDLLAELDQNGAQLRPLETHAASRPKKQTELDDVRTKLRVAEEGKLKDLVAVQTRVGAEKALVKAYGDIRDFYAGGISMQNFERDAARMEASSGARTGTPAVEAVFRNLKAVVEEANSYLKAQQLAVSTQLQDFSRKLAGELDCLALLHAAKDSELASQVAAFQKAGLSASVADIQRLVARQGQLTNEINRIDLGAHELKALRDARHRLLTDLEAVRAEITERRKALVRKLNSHLATVIDDYTVALRLDPEGITDDFVAFVSEVMRGSYLTEDSVRRLCARVSPPELARFVVSKDAAGLSTASGLTREWAERLCASLQPLERAHQLEAVWKTPRPEILVVPRTQGAKPIPVRQLSDGQRHTIFLTIALLAESDAPLLIDQPEDDLDNAFIYTSVVQTLRHVKERRQVLVVTHNANIAVLGDAELLLPLRRHDDRGSVHDRGSIDRKETRNAVQRILEGGEHAFRRRMEIYGY